MRLIPGKTKVKIELFKGVTLGDVLVGLVGLSAVALCAISSLPGRWIVASVFLAIFAMLLFRMNDEPMYTFLWHILRYRAYPRFFVKVPKMEAEPSANAENPSATAENSSVGDKESSEEHSDLEKEEDSAGDEQTEGEAQAENQTKQEESADSKKQKKKQKQNQQKQKKQKQPKQKKDAGKAKNAGSAVQGLPDAKELKEIIKEENKILKSKTATEEEKNAVWAARAERTAAKKKQKSQKQKEKSLGMDHIMPFTGVSGNFIEYGGEYFGAAIEIDPIEFRFFSAHRRNNAIESCFGKVLRSLQGDYGANIVKIQRPIIYDRYLDAEYEKLEALRKSYESGMFSEEELQARVEIQYDRIRAVEALCTDEKVIEPFYYLVLFDSDKGRLDVTVRQALQSLEQGELVVRRLDTKELAVFLKYTNTLDFDEKEIDEIPPEKWAEWAMPDRVRITMRKIEVDRIITHNMRVISYPSVVGDAWMAGVMSFPGTKVVVKMTPMNQEKSIRAIDRSLAELRAKYMTTSLDSKLIELQEHIDTLSSLLVTLKQDNETLLSVSIYVSVYDAEATRHDPVLSENLKTLLPELADHKRSVRRSYSEAGMKLSGMDFLQFQSFIGAQVSAYDPMVKDSRGIPSNTIAGMFPWIFAHISDEGGIKLGSADGVPVFINFFRRDSERVNSNMVIVGKSGSGKSYATKSLLTNLASEDAKIFILDPENEYSELAANLHGKVINVGNAQYGRLNPFHIITALDDDEAGEEGGGPGGSFATHLQFLEEFFRQILPDIDRDALEYLNSLVERVYLDFGITPETDLSDFTAEDYPIFDDLYDIVLAEFERTNNEYLRQMLRSLVNYIAKFSTGGRNANIWNGPSTITTDENFSVFNFQSMLANRNTTIANAQMLLVLKYIDNEIIKNRDYNIKYGLNRKVVVVIDEAHVFIDTKFPVALDFMFQLAKRIRKYNGMQLVITQNIKDFVGSEEIARKSTAIINACQYSFVFGLAPNDMDDLCRLYEKAGGINEREQEDILGAKRGEAFTIMSPTSRSSFMVEVPESMVDMFENRDFVTNYFHGEDGKEAWEEFVAESREAHDANLAARKRMEEKESIRETKHGNLHFSEGSGFGSIHFEEMDSADAGSGNSFGSISFEEESSADAGFGNSFGSISFEEESPADTGFGDSYGSIRFEEESPADAESGDSYGSIHFEEESPADTDSGNSYGSISFEEEDAAEKESRNSDSFKMIDLQSHLDERLSSFEDSLRKKMEDELIEKIRWFQMGAGFGAGALMPTGTDGMGSTLPERREEKPSVAQKSGEEEETEKPDTFSSAEETPAEEGFLPDESDSRFEESYAEEEDGDSLFDELYWEEGEEVSGENEDDSAIYAPTPFEFADFLEEEAAQYEEMDLAEKMAEMGEKVMEVSLEELEIYIGKLRKKKAKAI